jgi:flavorubredoxin
MLQKIRDLDIETIAPSHGYILRTDVEKYIEAYEEMSRPKGNKKAAILFSTMTGNTTKVAKRIAEGLEAKGIEFRTINVDSADQGTIKEAILEADALFFGSSTRYADMVGKLEVVLKDLKGMDLSEKLAIAFGSYGWSGEAVQVIQDYLMTSGMKAIDSSYIIKSTGMTHVQLPLRVKFAPSDEGIDQCVEVGKVIGDLLIG